MVDDQDVDAERGEGGGDVGAEPFDGEAVAAEIEDRAAGVGLAQQHRAEPGAVGGRDPVVGHFVDARRTLQCLGRQGPAWCRMEQAPFIDGDGAAGQCEQQRQGEGFSGHGRNEHRNRGFFAAD
jgi:hypothetical protein